MTDSHFIFLVNGFESMQRNFLVEHERIYAYLDAGKYVLVAGGNIHKTNIIDECTKRVLDFSYIRNEIDKCYSKLVEEIKDKDIINQILPVHTEDWSSYLKTYDKFHREILDELKSMHEGKHPIQISNRSKKGWFKWGN